MILGALADYYARRLAEPDSGIAPPGWEWKALPFLIEIDHEGRFIQLVDTRTNDGRRVVASRYLVRKAVVRTVGVKANLLWDNLEYVAGTGPDGATARVVRQHAAFVEAITDRFGPAPDDPAVAAVVRFVAKLPAEQLATDPLWGELVSANPFVSFRLAGETTLVCQGAAVRASLATDTAGSATVAVSLLSGERQPVARLHPPIKGVRGANSTGAGIVSFNLPAFESYGATQGDNAPVSEADAFAYTTGLNSLLGPGSRQRALVADTTVVFWGERREATDLEEAIAALFSEPPKDDPHAGTAALDALYHSHRTGTVPADQGGRFYVLGLAPNAARLAIRFWHVGTVREMGERIVAHFDDLEIVRGPFDPPRLTLFRVLASTAVLGRADAVSPLLGGEVTRAILEGLPYPTALLDAAVRRSRSEQNVTYPRAAAIKASLNRLVRSSRLNAQELTVTLDPANPDPAYRLGRLFAVLERAQELASPGLNATIRDRYYGAASTTPIAVFPRLLSLKNHHVAKIEPDRRRLGIERLIGEIVDGIVDIPAHLPLAGQGAFAVGYYHQRQDFFVRRSESAAAPEGTN